MDSTFSTDNFDQQEALRYRPGQRVELKATPGIVDVIAEYDPMMVPPIWLANDPKPRYAHELNLLPMSIMDSTWLRLSRRRSVGHPAGQSRAYLATRSQ
ncbi:MAG TPA: hypothetical protein V6D14_03800 [Coleofasciculaceae cyanobacterium]|jgi:hypothetical protein